MTSVNKMSKKERRAFYSSQRGDWNGIKPYTRVFRDGKTYLKADRNKAKAALKQRDIADTES